MTADSDSEQLERTWPVARAALEETWGSLAGVGHQCERTSGIGRRPCPGWSVKDQFSHLIGIERMLLGDAGSRRGMSRWVIT